MADKKQAPQSSASSPETATPTQAPDRTGGKGNAALLAEIAEAAKDDGDDDYIRDTIGKAHLDQATPQQKAAMIRNLLDGVTGDDDEAKILEILQSPQAKATVDAVKQMGNMEWLLDDVNGEEHDQLLALLSSIEKTYQQTLEEEKKKPQTAPVAPVAPEIPATPPEAPSAPKELSPERKKALYEAERRMGSVAGAPGQDNLRHGDKPKLYDENGQLRNDTLNLFENTREQSSGTSCGLLPGTVLKTLGLGKNARVKAITAYVTSGGPGGMEDLATQYGAWVPSTGTNLPEPGDIFVVNNPEGEFAHVGIISSVDDKVWMTLNSGGGRGAEDKTLKADRHVMSKEEKERYNQKLTADQAVGGGMKDPTTDQKAARKSNILKGSKRALTAEEQQAVDKTIKKTPLDISARYLQGNGNAPDAPADEPRRVHGWVNLDKLVKYANGQKP